MKLLFCLMFLLPALSAKAAVYDCKTSDGSTEATLEIRNEKSIFFNDESHSAQSEGVFAGIDKAPYSPRKGELQFILTDFYRSDDESFKISIPPVGLRFPAKLKITQYFDNDDHEEQVEALFCRLKK